MTTYTCDMPGCSAQSNKPLPIQFSGYYPRNAGGIMLPEGFRHFDFCSHTCAVRWIRWAICHEPHEPGSSQLTCEDRADISNTLIRHAERNDPK